MLRRIDTTLLRVGRRGRRARERLVYDVLLVLVLRERRAETHYRRASAWSTK